MSFFGRKRELAMLQAMYDKKGFCMPVIYGRRRVGKTRLLKELCGNKQSVFFTAAESTGAKNLSLFSQCIYEAVAPDMAELPPFAGYEQAFAFLAEKAKQTRLIVVIDEYPYLAASEPSVSSLLQAAIDHLFSKTQMMLILCGSSMSFMEHQVLGAKSPLYGRRTAQIKLLPLDYHATAGFTPSYSLRDKLLVYAVTGGVPKYLEQFDNRRSVHHNIRQLFFNAGGYLYEEPANLLKQEFREVASYNAVMDVVASGATKMNEIVTKAHLDTASVSYCLKSLASVGLVKKEHAVTEEKNKKKSGYTIADHMFRFWYRYVSAASGLIEIGRGEDYYDQVIKKSLNEYVSVTFEEVSRYYLMENADRLSGGFLLSDIGKWWGTDPETRREEEIDIVATSAAGRRLLIGECKYRNEKMKPDTLRLLQKRAGMIHGYDSIFYVLFSAGGFSNALTEEASGQGIPLLTLKDIYGVRREE